MQKEPKCHRAEGEMCKSLGRRHQHAGAARFVGRTNERDATEGKHHTAAGGAANYVQSSVSLNQNNIFPVCSYVVETLL